MVSVVHVAVCRSLRKGFALVLALGLMALLVLLVLSLATLGRIETEAAYAQRNLRLARQNALFALDLAMARLREHAGPDQRVTARADLAGHAENGFWTGVWDFTRSDPPTVHWLVSGNQAPGDFRAPADPERLRSDGAVWLVWKNTVEERRDYVAAPLVPLSSRTLEGTPEVSGHYAYWVGDEGVKASLRAVDLAGFAVPGLAAQPLRQRTNPAHGVQVLLPDWRPLAEGRLGEMARLSNPWQVPAMMDAGSVKAWRRHWHDLTAISRGLLTNPDPVSGGGLRINLGDTGEARGRDRFSDPFASGQAVKVWRAFPRLDAQGRLPLVPISLTDYQELAPDQPYVSVIPIPTEVALRLVVFDHRQRGEPAIRFSLEAEFVNPFTAPLLLSPDDRRALTIDVSGLPLLTVENLSTGEAMGPLPIDEMPVASGVSRTASYMEFDETPGAEASGAAVLGAGETYRLTEPGPAVQPEGLVKYTEAELEVENGHDILVSLEPVFGNRGVDFAVHRGSDNQGERIWQLRDLPFEGTSHRFEAPLDEGDRPYRIASTGVEVGTMAVFGFHYALGPQGGADGSELGRWLESFDLRRPEIDTFGSWQPADGNARANREFIRSATEDPAAIQEAEGELFARDDWSFDRLPRDSTAGTHADLRLYDTPQGQPVSIADFRLLPFKGRPPRALGSPSGDELNPAFDRYFLSTVPADWQPTFGGRLTDDILLNSRLELMPQARDANGQPAPFPTAEELRGEDAARHFRVRGAFNWNSTSEHAWQAVLTQSFSDGEGWIYVEPDGGLGNLPIGRAIFRHPLGAPAGGRPLPDAAFRSGNLSADALRQAHSRQGVRLLGPDEPMKLASAIVSRLRARGRPFPSLAAFMNAGLLEGAIGDSGINDGFPRHANGHVSQSDLVALLSLGAAARSDTFRIRAYGDTWNSRTGRVEGRAALEALVQRTLYPVDAEVPVSGANDSPRRFGIIAFRWLDPDREL